MTPVVLYAVSSSRLSEPLPEGAVGELLAQVEAQGVVGIVGAPSPESTTDETTLLQYADVVQELATRTESLLPARWGSTFPSLDEARAALASKAASLSKALDEVAGCVEIGVRGNLPRDERPQAPPTSGTEYLEQKRADARRRDAVMADVHEPLARRARRATFHADGDGFAGAYLVPKGESAAFVAAIEALAARHPLLVLVAVGPWPVYSFSGSLEK